MTQPKKTMREIKQVVDSIDPGEGSHIKLVTLHDMGGEHYYIQGEYLEADATKPLGSPLQLQKTRKWLVSPYSTNSEIVETVFAMLQRSSDHRLREFFTYKGFTVKNRHLDVEKVTTIAGVDSLDGRS